MTATTRVAQRPVLLVLQTLFGGLVGGVFTYSCVKLVLMAGIPLRELGNADLTALGLTAFFLATGLFAVWMSWNRRYLGRQLERDDPRARPATALEARTMRLQGYVLLLTAAILPIPVLAPRLAGAPVATAVAVAVLLLLFGVHSWVNLRIWRESDEFMRQLILSSAATSFWVLQGALFLYAVFQRLRLVAALSIWDASILALALYGMVSLYLSARRASMCRGGRSAEM